MPDGGSGIFIFLPREIRPCALAAGEPELLAPPASDEFLLPQAFAGFSNQRIFGGLSPDAQVGAVRIRERGCFKALPHPSLIVIDVGQITVRNRVVHEELQRFAPPFDATVKL